MSDAHPRADVIIVGAGSAGCVLAARLSADPGLTVLLVEAGGEARDPRIADPGAWALLQGSDVDWQFMTEPQPAMAGRAHPWPRGKVVGGSSAIHAMGHMRGHRADFDNWASAGATGWDHAALLPYFIRSERSPFGAEPGYGDAGPIHLVQPETPHPLTQAHRAAGAACGLTPIRDHNGGQMHGPTLNTMTLVDGKRQSVADAYLTADTRARPNLTLLTGVLVDRLHVENGRVTGLTGTRDGAQLRLAARAGVILSAGAIGSPTILMRSGIGRAQDLQRLGIPVEIDHPEIGANLQDHLLSAGNVYASRQPVPMSATQHSESLTYIHADGQDAQEAPELVVGIVTLPVVSDAFAARPVPGIGSAYTLMFGITHPRSRGRLALSSAAPSAPPVIDPAYLSAPEDRAHFLQALDWARRLGAAEAYAPWRAEEVLPRADDLQDAAARLAFVEAAAFTHHHPVGTCRMGADGAAPVGPDLAVKGVQGLHVVDGAILPGLTTGPVNAAIVAVAERASDLLARHFRQ